MVPARIVVIVTLLALQGCAGLSGSFCDVEKPIRTPIADMTPAEQRQALAHNLKGAELCGWTP